MGACLTCLVRKRGVRNCCALGHHRPGYKKRRAPLQRCLKRDLPPCPTCQRNTQGTRFCCAAGHHEGHRLKPGPRLRQDAQHAGPQLSPQRQLTRGPPGCLPRRQAHLVLLSVRLCSLGMAPSDDYPCPFRPVRGALRRRCLHPKSPSAASPRGPCRQPQATASGDCWMTQRTLNQHQPHDTSGDARVGLPWALGW